MTFDGWSIFKTKNGNMFIYGYEEEMKKYGEEECKKEFGIEPEDEMIPRESWDASAYAYIFARICEDNNRHKMAGFIYSIIMNSLKNSGIPCGPNEPGTVFVKEFVEEYVKNAGWDN